MARCRNTFCCCGTKSVFFLSLSLQVGICVCTLAWAVTEAQVLACQCSNPFQDPVSNWYQEILWKVNVEEWCDIDHNTHQVPISLKFIHVQWFEKWFEFILMSAYGMWNHQHGNCCQVAIRKVSQATLSCAQFLIDLTKAFGTVIRDGLWKIIAKCGCSKNVSQ